MSVGFAARRLAHLHDAHSHSYQWRARDGKVMGGPAAGDLRTGSHASTPARGRDYGPTFSPGDTVGCGLDVTHHAIYFTKNGVVVGSAFRGVPCGDEHAPLLPTAGLHAPGERVRLNFGGAPFVFDLEAYRAARDEQLESQLDAIKVPRRALRQMVVQYLLREGYSASASALEIDTRGMPSAGASSAAPGRDERQTLRLVDPAHLQATAEERASLRNALTSGRPEAAVAYLEQRLASGHGHPGHGHPGHGHPGHGHPGLVHAKSLVFLELVRKRKTLEAIVYAKDHLAPFLEGAVDEAAAAPEHSAPHLPDARGSDEETKKRRRRAFSGAYVTAAMTEQPSGLDPSQGPALDPPELPCALPTVLGILAHEEPAKSPLAFLLSPRYAHSVADLANEAVLELGDGAEAAPQPPALRVLVRQLQATRQLASELGE